MPTLSAEVLTRLGIEIFTRAGAPQEHARCVTEHLVEANLAGHDSHGVLRIPQYVDLIDAGRIKPAATMSIVHEAPASAVVDGGGGFGQVIAREAMLLATRKAKAGGIGAVAVRHCSHTGRIGTYTHLAAKHNYIGIATVNSGGGGQTVAPHGGVAGVGG
jgi:hydroxycarboxylate dehydrogenase B